MQILGTTILEDITKNSGVYSWSALNETASKVNDTDGLHWWLNEG